VKFLTFLFTFLSLRLFAFQESDLDENSNDLTQTITIYSSEAPSLVLSKHYPNGLILYYNYDEQQRCISKRLHLGSEQILRTFFYYNSQGEVAQVIVDDGIAEEEGDLTGAKRRQRMTIEWGVQGKPLLVENHLYDFSIQEFLLVDRTLYYYDTDSALLRIEFYDRNNELVSCIDEESPDGAPPPSLEFNENILETDEYDNDRFIKPLQEPSISWLNYLWMNASHAFFAGSRHMQNSANQFVSTLGNELYLPDEVNQGVEDLGKSLFGDQFYFLMGLETEKTLVGCYPGVELNPKVRVTFINGILTTQAGMQENLEFLSQSHGGIKVNYVFRPTEGWAWDISRAVLIRTAFALGFRSWHANLLARQWRYLINEMGGVDGGGVIIHYAHSLGGTETDRARELLSLEEQKMIRVITFGSATLIRNQGFQSVHNHVSINDGVPSFLLEPLGKLRNYFDPESNVIYHGSLFESKPMCDHLISGITYSRLISECGSAFLEEFLAQ